LNLWWVLDLWLNYGWSWRREEWLSNDSMFHHFTVVCTLEQAWKNNNTTWSNK
jgi:hypothetical protein